MRILITGGLGQLGTALQKSLVNHELAIVDLPEVDVTNRVSIGAVIADWSPQLVIHCAAYTDVDGCARDPLMAYNVNGLGSLYVAQACNAVNAAMLQVSTNEVFAGSEPGGYFEWSMIKPLNAYGRSKAAGEFFVRRALQDYYIVRTAWLYGPTGKNFIHAILNKAMQGGPLNVVVDEIGNPTFVDDLASAIAELIKTNQYGIYHFTNEGACSRWAFAKEILQLKGVSDIEVNPILVRHYTRASAPPKNGSLLNTVGRDLGIILRPWSDALADCLNKIP